MGRKSRYNPFLDQENKTAVCATQTDSCISTGIYVRLSVEKDDNGDSIENQTRICQEFVDEQTDLKLFQIYEDNGRTGTNFERPGFLQLMADIRAGIVKCVVVKDLSRFGRDYIEAGAYIEQVFPFLGVRFISITDGYDSKTATDDEESLMIPLKNMLNEAYAKDISRKITTTLRARQEKGEVLHPFPPYGYVRSVVGASRYEVDEAVAPYVRMIFEWKAAGDGYGVIAKRLNEIKAVSPAQRKVELEVYHAEKYKTMAWNSQTVRSILRNPTYIGCIVYGKVIRSLYQGIKYHRTDRREWRILPDRHEPIISKELFDRVQEIMDARMEAYQRKKEETKEQREAVVNLFEKKIYCGDCGKRIQIKRTRRIRMKQKYYCTYYTCTGYEYNKQCSSHLMNGKKLEDAVLAEIQMQLSFCVETEKLIARMRDGDQEKSLVVQYSLQVNRLSNELKKVQERISTLLENLNDGILDQTDYLFAKNKYEEETVRLGKDLEEAEKRKKELADVLSKRNRWMTTVHRAERVETMDASLVDALISKVYVFENKRIAVEYKYVEQKSAFERIASELQEMERPGKTDGAQDQETSGNMDLISAECPEVANG